VSPFRTRAVHIIAPLLGLVIGAAACSPADDDASAQPTTPVAATGPAPSDPDVAGYAGAMPKAIPAAPARPDVPTYHPPERAVVRDSWRRFGISGGRTYKFSGLDQELQGTLVAQRGQVRMPLPVAGVESKADIGTQVGTFDLGTGMLTRKPVTPGWFPGWLASYGDRLVWIEKQIADDRDCADASWGCRRWAMFSSYRDGAATMLVQQPIPVPMKGAPEFVHVNQYGVCWTASDDGKTWSAYGLAPGGQPKRLMSVAAWLRECELVGRDDALVIQLRQDETSGFETVVRAYPDGTTRVFASYSEQVIVRRGLAATITAVDRERGFSKIQIRPVDGSEPPRTVWQRDRDAVYYFGWLADDVLWASTTSGLYLIRISTGESERINAGPSPVAGHASSGDGHLVFGLGGFSSVKGASQDLTWRLVVLDAPGA
jgi:hypothetical protein